MEKRPGRIAPVCAVRRFFHATCFKDSTHHLEWKRERMFVITKDGREIEVHHWNLEKASRFVADGVWIEK